MDSIPIIVIKPEILERHLWNGRHYARVRFPDGRIEEIKLPKEMAATEMTWAILISKCKAIESAIEKDMCPTCGRPY